MKLFYDHQARIIALNFHAAELVDTPFAPHAMVPGAGIDCVHVNAWCYLKTGFLKTFEPPRYSMDLGDHAKESALIGWLDGRDDFKRILMPPSAEDPMAGDAICFNMGMSEHHVGLMINGKQFVHVLPRRRVIISSLVEPAYARRVTAMYRPMDT